MTTLTQLTEAQAGKTTTINEILTTLQWAGIFARNYTTSAGLTHQYFGGYIYVDGVPTLKSNSSVALTNATNYVEVDRAGTISVNTSGFTAGQIPLYVIVAAGGVVSTITDWRPWSIRVMESRLSKAIGGSGAVTLTDDEARVKILEFTGALSGNRSVEVPSAVWDYVVFNNTTGDFTLTVLVNGQTGIVIPRGATMYLYVNNTDVKAEPVAFEIGAANIGAFAVLKASVDTTQVGNIGVGEDDLITYSLPADAMSVAGKGVRITAWGTFPNNADTKTLKIYFGSQVILTYAFTVSIDGAWRAVAEVFSTGTDTQDYVAQLNVFETTPASAIDIETGTATQDDGAAITIKCTGEATSDNDIVQLGQLVEFLN